MSDGNGNTTRSLTDRNTADTARNTADINGIKAWIAAEKERRKVMDSKLEELSNLIRGNKKGWFAIGAEVVKTIGLIAVTLIALLK